MGRPRMGRKQRRRFSREFKLEAVKLVKESGADRRHEAVFCRLDW